MHKGRHTLRLKQTCRKHSHTNFRYLDNVVNVKEFEAFCKFEDDLRPIFIVIVDGGPDGIITRIVKK